MKKALRAFLFLLEIFVISLIVITIVFLIMSIVPGANSISAGIADKDLKEVIEHKYGYDQDVWHRYIIYLGNIFKGDFGISTSIMPNQEINSFIWNRVGTSMSIGLSSLCIAYGIGFPLGLYVGQRQGKATDTIASAATALIISIPAIVFGLVLLIFGRSVGLPYIFDKQNIVSYLLPMLVLVLTGTVGIMKFTRVQVVAEVNSQYSKLAAVKGVKKRRFIWVHAIRPTSFLIISGLPGAIMGTIFGSMFIETIFQIPGTGAMLISAITTKDINVIMFIVMLLTIITVISFRLRDVLYRLLDPRMRGR